MTTEVAGQLSKRGMAEPPRRGRPRSEKAQKAILEAAIELLLEHGLHAMSMDDVAERAGVSKATIYRWWPSKELLAVDALASEWAPGAPAAERDTGTLRGDLLVRFRPWLRQLNEKPFGRVVAGLVAEAQTDAGFAQLYREHFVQPRRDATRPLLLRAIDRGEIALDTDLEVTLDLLYGPIYHRLLHGHAPLNDRFVQQVIDTVIAAISSRGLGERRQRTPTDQGLGAPGEEEVGGSSPPEP
jgi:AcrR family transcriptional regulator